MLYAGAQDPGIYANLITFRKGSLYESNGTKLVWMTITPRSAAVTGASLSGQTLRVSWSSAKNAADGYQIQVSTSKTFSKSTTKTYTVSGASTKKLVKTLSSKTKKYKYVRVRAYAKGTWHGITASAESMRKNGASASLYSKWSAVKSLTTSASGKKAA